MRQYRSEKLRRAEDRRGVDVERRQGARAGSEGREGVQSEDRGAETGGTLLLVSDSPAHTHTHLHTHKAHKPCATPGDTIHCSEGIVGRNGSTHVRNRTTGFATPSRLRSHPWRSQIATLNTYGIRRRTTDRRYDPHEAHTHTHTYTCLLRCGASDEVVERLFQAKPGAVRRRRPHAGGVSGADQE